MTGWKLPIQMVLLENYVSNLSKGASNSASNIPRAHYCPWVHQDMRIYCVGIILTPYSVVNKIDVRLYCKKTCFNTLDNVWPLLSSSSVPGHRNYTPAPYRGNPNRRTGILKINIIICLDRASSIIPKIGSPIWDDLKSRNMIKENIEIPTHSSSTEINEMISNLFPDLKRKRWCLLNSSSCTLKKVPYNEITCELIKQNLTKAKKMYIGIDTPNVPDGFEIGDPFVFDVFNVANFFNVPEVSDVANSFNVPEVSEVSNGFDVPMSNFCI
ncbi:hypothetical protein RhiirA4_450671 [Rhizophagus irregularis]|uniref:Uncharacterized protein n=1 Tax=Rhizophagus irregularis TaxID=588596 RepID=A0A2I1FTR7_9GLOM|nr:hypothetical protein RhiirA4_450671 [Rhizophagus irregularis]